MYDIYISNYLDATGSNIIQTESLFFSIPIVDPANTVKDPVCKCEMGKSGSFEFSIMPTHPFYNRFQQMLTVMRIEYDGETIFRGRVLTIDTNKLNGTRKVHLEGDIAFLMDSYQEGIEEADRPKIDVYTYLKNVIQIHNDQMDVDGSRHKKFELGEVPGHYSLADASQRITVEDSKFGSSSWQKTQDALNALTKEYGGYFRTRYDSSTGKCYFDWLEAYFTLSDSLKGFTVFAEGRYINSSGVIASDLNFKYTEDYTEVNNGVTYTFLINYQTVPASSSSGLIVSGYDADHYFLGNTDVIPSGFPVGEQVVYYKPTPETKFIRFSIQSTGTDVVITDRVNTQPIKIAENMIDLNDTSEVDNLFTVLTPIGNNKKGKKLYIDNYNEQYHGDNKSITVPQMADYLIAKGRTSEMEKGFHSAYDYLTAIQHYGVIYKTQEFSDADTQSKLWDTAINWIRDNYIGGVVNFTANALDLHHLNPNNNQKYLVGERLVVIYPEMSRHTSGVTPTERRALTLLSVQYNLYNPDKNSYTIGIPSTLLSKSYSSRSSKKKTSMDAGSSKATSSQQAEDKQRLDSLQYEAEVFVISKEFNSEDYKYLDQTDEDKANAAVKAANVYVHSIYKATKGDQIWVKTTSAPNQTTTDIDSIYKASNNTQWKLKKIYSTQVLLEPVADESVLPESGTLTWVSGGYVHTSIPYGSYAKSKDPRQWVYYTPGTNVKSANKKAIYKDSNNAEWEVAEVVTSNWKIELIPLDSSSTLPGSGTLIFVRGGSGSPPATIPYDKTKSNIENVVSNAVVMSMDGSNGTLTGNRRINNIESFTEEEIRAYNGFIQSVTIAAANEEIGLTVAPQYDANGHMTNFLEFMNQFDLSPVTKLTLRHMWNEGKLDGLKAPVSFSVNSETGTASLMQSVVGQDGTGVLGTIFQSGKEAVVSILNPSKAGSTDPDDTNVELEGGGDNGGGIGVGKKTTTSGSKKWTITLNKNLVWYETNPDDPEHPIEHRVPAGTVGAEDYYLDSIPSFKTDLAVINQAIIGVAHIDDLDVINGFIRDLQGEDAVIQRVTALNGNFGGMTSTLSTSTEFNLSDGSKTISALSDCLIDCSAEAGTGADLGKIVFTFTRASRDVSKNLVVPFDIADTQFYKNAVSAAKDTGWNDARSYVIGTLPTSGQQQTVPNDTWDINVPRANYGSDYDPVPITVSGLQSYTYRGTTYHVVIAKIGEYNAYIKTINFNAPEIHDAYDVKVTGSVTINSTQYFTPMITLYGSTVKSGTMITVNPPDLQNMGRVNATITNDRTVTSTDGSYGMSQVVIPGIKISGISLANVKYNTAFKIGDNDTDNRFMSGTGTFTGASTVSSGQIAATASKILSGYSAWVDGEEVQGTYTPTSVNLQANKNAYPTGSTQPITPDNGYDGLLKVTVGGVTTSNLAVGNVKYGVEVKVGNSQSAGAIKDFTGTFTGASTVSTGQTAATASKILSGYSAWVDGAEVKGSYAVQASKNAYPTGSTQNITPDSGKSSMEKVVVGGVTTDSLNVGNVRYGSTVKVGNSQNASAIKEVIGEFTKANTVSSGQTAAAAAQILSGYSAWVDGEEVQGTYTPTSVNLQTNKNAYPTGSTQPITPDNGYDGLLKVTVGGVTTDSLTAGNVRYGSTVKVGNSQSASAIKEVVGEFTKANTVSTGQTAATASKILSGYSAWVDGAEVKGSLVAADGTTAWIVYGTTGGNVVGTLPYFSSTNKYAHIIYNDTSGAQHDNVQKWQLPADRYNDGYILGASRAGQSAIIMDKSTAGSDPQGTLTAGSYVYTAYFDGNGNLQKNEQQTWLVPSGGSASASDTYVYFINSSHPAAATIVENVLGDTYFTSGTYPGGDIRQDKSWYCLKSGIFNATDDGTQKRPITLGTGNNPPSVLGGKIYTLAAYGADGRVKHEYGSFQTPSTSTTYSFEQCGTKSDPSDFDSNWTQHQTNSIAQFKRSLGLSSYMYFAIKINNKVHVYYG